MRWTIFGVVSLSLSLAVRTGFAAEGPDGLPVAPDRDAGLTIDSPGTIRVGAGIGTPAGIDLFAGLGLGPVAVKLSGGSWGPDWHGWQVGLTLNLTGGGSLEQGPAVIAGGYTLKPPLAGSEGAAAAPGTSDRYLGLAYDAMVGPVAIQLGLAVQDHHRDHTLVAVQIGYLFSFL